MQNIHDNIDPIWNTILDSDILGIGEQAHGDNVSMHIRFYIMERLLSEGWTLWIACECADAHLQFLRSDTSSSDISWKWSWYIDQKGNKRFLPHLTPHADKTEEHLDFLKKMTDLRKKYGDSLLFFGIEIQQCSFEHLSNSLSPIVKKCMNQYNQQERWNRASNSVREKNNKLRNELNSLTLRALFDLQRITKVENKRKKKVIQLYHNEHIARSSNASRSSKSYFTLPQWLLQKLSSSTKQIKYLSMGTHALNLHNTWEGMPPRCFIDSILHENLSNASHVSIKKQLVYQPMIFLNHQKLKMKFFASSDFDIFILFNGKTNKMSRFFPKPTQKTISIPKSDYSLLREQPPHSPPDLFCKENYKQCDLNK